jgi:hypothetical protein
MSRTARIDLFGDRIEIRRRGGGEAATLLDADYEDLPALVERMHDALTTDPGGRWARWELRLHPPLVQVRTLHDLPPVPERHLREVVEQNSARFFRAIGTRPIVAASWQGRTEAGRVARGVAADRAFIERLEAAICDSGVRLTGIQAVHDRAGPGIALVTRRLRRATRRGRVSRAAAAVVLAAGGWLVASSVYVMDLHRDDQWTRAELGRLEAPLRQLDSIGARVGAFAPIAAAVDRQSSREGRVSDVLIGIALHLPSDTHVHRVVLERGKDVLVVAHGPDPVATVQAFGAWWPGPVRLQRAPDATGPEPAGPFTIAMEVGP